jgi:hypothetical protein
MPAEDIRLAGQFDGHTHTLRIEIASDNGLETFRQVLSKMASGETEQIRLLDLDGVRWPQNGQLSLQLATEDPTKTVNVLIHGWAVKRNWDPMFIWMRSMDGWRRCAELAETLSPGRPQNFSVEADGVGIEVARLE